MPAPPPQALSQELLAVLLLALFPQPPALLRVGGGLEGQAAYVQAQAQDVRQGDGGGQSAAYAGQGVEREDGEAAGGDPGRLGEEGEEELAGLRADGGEAGVDPDGGAEDYLPPVPAAGAAGEGAEDAGPCWLYAAAGGGGGTGAEGGEVEAQGGAGEVGQGAGEVVEAFALGDDGGDGDGALQCKGQADRRNQRREEWSREIGGMEDGVEERHSEERGNRSGAGTQDMFGN
ncbi:MAG: hypothetical protein Q9167_007663 [Letrouitia subvulpina]